MNNSTLTTPPLIDPVDAMLIHRLHGDFPLSDQPFDEVGQQLGLSEDEVITRLQRMLADGLLTRFGPLFQIERAGGQFVLAAMQVPEERFDAVAAQLGLAVAKVRHLPFVKLSGGMKQKILIAVALGRDCELLILDEPAANLDPEARHAFFGLLAERVGRATMLISSHRLDEVAPLVNRVLELDMGRIVLDDRVADDVALAGKVRCRLVLRRVESAIAKTLAEWGLSGNADGLVWHGAIAGPDRLRFLGMLARYVGVLTHIEMEEQA